MKPHLIFALTSTLFSSFAPTADGAASVTLVPTGAIWRYLDNGSDQGSAWTAPAFNDSSWPAGAAQLGYGDGDETTVINGGPANNRHPTTYFRRTFTAPDVANVSALTLRLMRDDGAVVYLNGVEVHRNNMPGGFVSYLTYASVTVSGADEFNFYSTEIDSSPLVQGANVLAVEIHRRPPPVQT